MFCQRCGTAMLDTAVACLSCNAPIASSRSAPASAAVADTVKAAARDALAAFRTLAVNPVAGLSLAHGVLGPARALRTGVAFGLFSLACFLLGGYLLLPAFMKEDLFEFLGFGGVLKCLLFGAVPFVCTAAGSAGLRKLFGGQSTLGDDLFIAGAALVPASVCMLVSGLLGLGNYKTIGALAVFAGCFGILMLFSGYTRISKLSERAASFGVPAVVLLSVWLAKVLSTSVLTGGGGPTELPPEFFGY